MAVKLGFGRYFIQINGSEPDTIVINDGLNANDAIKMVNKQFFHFLTVIYKNKF